MAVSTKTLTPTGQVVSIPDMTEKPNNSVITDGIAKEADAINELNSKITQYRDWSLLDTKTGSASMSLPSSYNELYVVIASPYVRMIYITKIAITSGGQFFYTGDQGCSAMIRVQNGNINLYSYTEGTTDKTATTTISVYHR